jgi:hypothetical protein
MLPDCITAPALAQRLQVATSTVHYWRTCGLAIRRSDGTTDYVRLAFRVYARRVLIPLSGEERRDGTRVLGAQEFVEALRHDPMHRPGLPSSAPPLSQLSPLPPDRGQAHGQGDPAEPQRYESHHG